MHLQCTKALSESETAKRLLSRRAKLQPASSGHFPLAAGTLRNLSDYPEQFLSGGSHERSHLSGRTCRGDFVDPVLLWPSIREGKCPWKARFLPPTAPSLPGSSSVRHLSRP